MESHPHRPGVLVVDDGPDVRLLLTAALQQGGFAVWLAGSAQEALDLYRQHREAIDLVLLDVQMPDMDGWEILATLRATNPDLRYCIMSGDPDHHLEKAMVAQGVPFLPKPFRIDVLVPFLQYLLDRSSQSSHASSL